MIHSNEEIQQHCNLCHPERMVSKKARGAAFVDHLKQVWFEVGHDHVFTPAELQRIITTIETFLKQEGYFDGKL